jgi:hypothetical protein
MSNLHKVSKYTDLTQEQFKECLERMDMKTFIDNPKQAMLDAGIVATEEEVKVLSSNVFALIRNDSLSMDTLDKVAGGTDGRSDWLRSELAREHDQFKKGSQDQKI